MLLQHNTILALVLCIVLNCALFSILCIPFVVYCTPLCIVLHCVLCSIVYCTPYMYSQELPLMYFTSYVYCNVSVPHSKHDVYFVLPYLLRFVMHCHVLCVVMCLPYVSETIWFRTSVARPGLGFRPDTTYCKSKGSGPCQLMTTKPKPIWRGDNVFPSFFVTVLCTSLNHFFP
jgi:hypothetical protein